jgi:hypothetical protein
MCGHVLTIPQTVDKGATFVGHKGDIVFEECTRVGKVKTSGSDRCEGIGGVRHGGG